MEGDEEIVPLIFYLFCFHYILFYFILFVKTISVQEKYNASHTWESNICFKIYNTHVLEKETGKIDLNNICYLTYQSSILTCNQYQSITEMLYMIFLYMFLKFYCVPTPKPLCPLQSLPTTGQGTLESWLI